MPKKQRDSWQGRAYGKSASLASLSKPCQRIAKNREAAAELKEELPFLQTDLLTEEYLITIVDAIFGTDRQGVAKGMIEVIL